MFCSHCGKEIDDKAVVCIHCGCAVKGNGTVPAANDESSLGYGILGFFLPLIGFIVYLTSKDNYPLRAKSAGKGALIGFCVGVFFYILSIILLALA